jgi:hypothetical protein
MDSKPELRSFPYSGCFGRGCHHPHVHMIVPGGGFSADGSKWIPCRPRYFLTAKVLSALFRRLFLEMLLAAHSAGRLQFFGDLVALAGNLVRDDLAMARGA